MTKSKTALAWVGILFAMFSALSVSAQADEFEVLFVGQQTIDNRNCIAVTFSAAVDGKQDINRFLALYAEKEGLVDGAWVLSEKATVAYFTNIEADSSYEVHVRKGLPAADGKVLKETLTRKVRTRKAQAFIAFSGQGYILPDELNNGLPVNTMNVRAADIDFFRVHDKHLVNFIAFFGKSNQVPYYQAEEMQRFCELVYSARFDLDPPKNVMTKAVLPIEGINALEVPGLYMAVMRQAGTYNYQNPFTYFTISDIGLHLRVYPAALEIQTQHLGTSKIYPKVDLTFYDKEGDILERGRTDADGRATFGNLKDKAHLLVARQGRHTSILPLTLPALDLSALDVGEQPFRDLELFVYGPRDLYRPEETVILDALLRDYDGRPIRHKAPIAVVIKQPNGQKAKSFTWHGEALDAYHYEYELPEGTQTGTWIVECRLAGQVIQLYKFMVEDFMPERMKLTLDKGNTDVTRIGADDAIAMDVQGEYLYGAPAAGNRVDGNVSMGLLRQAVERLPGFEFGHVDEQVPLAFKTADLKLDAQGRGTLAVAKQWSGVRSPLKIRLHTNLYESGGRSVSRDKMYHMWPARHLVGVRPLWEGDHPPDDSLAAFEVVKADAQGTLVGAKALAVTLIREYPDYYWEYNADSGWERIVNSQHYPVARLELNIEGGQKATIEFPVEWGPYRLEITDPETGLTSAHRFSAGWSWWGAKAGQQGNRPDQVVLTLDKPAYRPGDTARVLVKPPESGTAIVTVESDRLLWRTVVAVKSEGTEVEIPVAESWDRHDLHVCAMVIRPGDRRKKVTPKRSLGIIHLPLERGDRRLEVSVQAPLKTRPNSTLTVDVAVGGASASPGDVYVALAAVDVGVLAITRFETPDPFDYFFQRRRYGIDCYDLYQKIIESHEGDAARLRYGGDGMVEMGRGGEKPLTDVRIVSIYKQRVRVDAHGKAQFTLDLPDFNGTLRLMAVAYSDRFYGSAETEVTLVSPVTAEIAMPRFLAMGDEARLALDIQNLSGRDQSMSVALATTAPIERVSSGTHAVTLADKQKTTLQFAVRAGYAVGVSDIDLTIGGIHLEEGPVDLRRRWRLGTRPPYPAITRQWRESLEPGQSLNIPASDLEDLLPGTVSAALTLTDVPLIDVAEHVEALYAYPYGCLEQTISGIYPQVFITSEILDQLKIKSQSPEERRKKVQIGIDRLLSKQKPNGGFGFWSGSGPEACWLTVYVCDFLISARDRGFEVPQDALAKALSRLSTYLQRPRTIQTQYTADDKHSRLAVQAYSAFVLARLNRASLGSMRTLFDNHAQESRSGLPLVHLGVALYLQGDGNRAEQAFEKALSINRDRHHYYGEYGSPVRDAAMSYYLLSRYAPGKGHSNAWLVKLDDFLRDRRWLSTQERNTLVLAGMQLLNGSGQTWQAGLERGPDKDSIRADRMLRFTYGYEQIRQGLRVTATSERPLYVNFVLIGYSKTPPKPESRSVNINRTFYNLEGRETDPAHLKTGDLLLVRLDVSSERRIAEGLVVELLPAGLELENQNLATGFSMDDLKVDGKTLRDWKAGLRLAHQEFRDDRYVAAIDVDNYRQATVFYLVRAVTPGVFRVPNSYVEDMYRPYLWAVGDTLESITVTQP